ncbi:MAG: hypothetical protein ACOC4Z_01675 [Patescibacteria group bacterium]
MNIPANFLGISDSKEQEPNFPKKENGLSLLKISTVLAIPAIFFLGGTAALVIFATLVIGNPIPISSPAENKHVFTAPPPQGKATVLGESVTSKEARPLILKRFFQSYNSPLSKHADYMVTIADKYDLDWRLLPAIAGQESTFCRTTPENSHNCWGWAVHERYTKKFSTYEKAIETVAAGLKENYIDHGLETPKQIMTKYCPRSITEAGGSWAEGVDYFIWILENFAQDYSPTEGSS